MAFPGHVGPPHPCPTTDEIVVIGAGPAGLTAALQLAKAGYRCLVLEADDVVGGLSRTVVADGYRFDIGGHRFFTKVPAVEALWHEILPGDDFLTRQRSSRVYYRGKFYDYPIRPANALRNLGPVEAARCLGSYLWSRVRTPGDPATLEGYVAAKYGRRLYRHFFETYTQKVWARPPSELSADWGAQRIKGMSLWSAVWEPLRARLTRRHRVKAKQVTSLIERFEYPRLGPGMMWERCTELVEAAGCKVILNATVERIEHRDGVAVAVTATDESGAQTTHPADHVISSMPLPALLRAMDPAPPADVLAVADGLAFRDFVSIALVVPTDKVPWTDNWIYIHDPTVKTMRVQNFGAWSPDLVRDGRNVLGLEYTVEEGDEWWSAPDEVLVERAREELHTLGLMDRADVETGYVVRMPKAYPVYDAGYQDAIAVLRGWIEANVANVHPVGRNGMHRYNNQDHSMFTAMLAVENILDEAGHDVWAVNVERAYHESADQG
jgi:protoporphyrinogen oxidase